MTCIRLGKKDTPLDWAEFQRRARRVLGRAVVVPSLENDFFGERLRPFELRDLGFKLAALSLSGIRPARPQRKEFGNNSGEDSF